MRKEHEDSAQRTVPLTSSSRAQKRLLERQTPLIRRNIEDYGAIPKDSLTPIDVVFEERDELALLKSDLKDYKEAQTTSRNLQILHRVYTYCGMSEHTGKCLLVPGYDRTSVQALLNSELNPAKVRQNASVINATRGGIMRSKIIHEDSEERQMVIEMDKAGVPVAEMLSEIIRSRQASIDLLQMEISYLEGIQRAQKEEKKRQEREERRKALEQKRLAQEPLKQDQIVTEVDSSVDKAVETQQVEVVKPFVLSSWDLYWTDRFWSSESHHLHPVNSRDREEMVREIDLLSRRQISISTGSVVRALEFHLHDRDRIQRALATRNKYVHSEEGQWVKIKRGKERIGVLVDQEQPNRAVFFVGGRDIVYRHN